MNGDPRPNIPLLRKQVEWVETENERPKPEREWDQDNWCASAARHTRQYGHPCGAAFCVAGHTVEEAGLEWSTHALAFGELADGRHANVVAADLLGLTPPQAKELFAAYNTAADIRRIAEGIAGERL